MPQNMGLSINFSPSGDLTMNHSQTIQRRRQKQKAAKQAANIAKAADKARRQATRAAVAAAAK
jgi:hypothetical protein